MTEQQIDLRLEPSACPFHVLFGFECGERLPGFRVPILADGFDLESHEMTYRGYR